MILKQLHIRNIASIERADIDFDHGLCDAVTGQPAPIFLISGDTGTGKSVILDGIAMALYKKTPRLADVANAIRNDFTDAEGESIRVASIEQYTRLGISEKDESYSEVVFEGNDGVTYTARLTLGMMRGNKDKTTGQRPLKHRSPRWELRIGDEDWTRDSVEATILRAVGLTFQQFGRMAMLAQGQFANFLTGDKREREAILEQLTNTQHFTAYGEAIQSIFRRAKEAMSMLQTQYDTERRHTLSDEVVEQLIAERRDAEQQKSVCEKDITAIAAQLRNVEAVLAAEQTQAVARTKQQETEAIVAGTRYQHSKALFTAWDATTLQRQHLTELLRARQDERLAKEGLAAAQDIFRRLSADLAVRRSSEEAASAAVLRLRQWLDSHNRHEALFLKAGETDLRISQFLAQRKSLEELRKTLEAETQRTAALLHAEADARARAEEIINNVRARQEEIDSLARRRAGLHPQAVIDELKQLNIRKENLVRLQSIIADLAPMHDDSRRLRDELQKGEATLATLQEACSRCDADVEAKKRDAEQAEKRLTTMRMSVDETIRELRHRLYDNPTERCPLCGQHIRHIHLDDEFANMLTPLQEEQRQTAEALRQASTQRDKAMGERLRHEGAMRTKREQREATDKKIARTQEAINEKATAMGLDPAGDLTSQITASLGELAAKLSTLEKAHREAEALQVEINRLLDAKKPFDTQKTEAERALLRAENDTKNNARTIERLRGDEATHVSDIEAIGSDITAALGTYRDDWQSDIEALRTQLRADADAYTRQQRQLAEAQSQQEKARTLVSSLTQLRQAILQDCPPWDSAIEPEAYPCRDISQEWTALLSRVTALTEKLRASTTTLLSATAALDDYYRTSGQDESSLQALMAQEADIAPARHFVASTDAQLKSLADAIADAQRQIDAALQALSIEDRAMLPDRHQLTEQRDAANTRRDELLARIAQAQSRLDTHNANIRHLREIETQLTEARTRFARWDRLNSIFGGTRFRTLVQTYVLRPLLNNANLYLRQITDRYSLTCNDANEQLSILVLDRYNRDQVRSATLLSGGERFIISLALALALSSLNRPDMNVNILFIDEGFGTLDERSLDTVMTTLEKLQEIAGNSGRRVAIISHREELQERIPVRIHVCRKGEGRSIVPPSV